MSTGPGAHSPLGFSGYKRNKECEDAPFLAYGLHDDESEHAAIGTLAHAVGETCLRSGMDAWEFVGLAAAHDGFRQPTVDETDLLLVKPELSVAVQLYVDLIRKTHPDRNQGNSGIERYFHCPSIHELCYGTCDFYYVSYDTMCLDVWDYKNGAGVLIDPENNGQCMGYAAMVVETLDLWDKIKAITIHIVQPNGFHFAGPHRTWTVSTADLAAWLEDECIPMLNRAGRRLLDAAARDLERFPLKLKSGEHCRFCEARSYACPQLMADMKELEAMVAAMEGRNVAELSDAEVGKFLQLFDLSKIVATAAGKTAFERSMAGKKIPGRKLVNARANRTWKDGAEKALTAKFGAKAYTDPELKSPAEIEKMPEGEQLTIQWAFKPEAGLTLVPEKDGRREVSRDTKSLFQPVK